MYCASAAVRVQPWLRVVVHASMRRPSWCVAVAGLTTVVLVRTGMVKVVRLCSTDCGQLRILLFTFNATQWRRRETQLTVVCSAAVLQIIGGGPRQPVADAFVGRRLRHPVLASLPYIIGGGHARRGGGRSCTANNRWRPEATRGGGRFVP